MDEHKLPTIDRNIHRRILAFLNAARRPEDLMVAPPNAIPLIDLRVMDGNDIFHLDEVELARGHRAPPPAPAEPLLERELAKRLIHARDEISPLYGFQHIRQVEKIPGFNRSVFDRLFLIFSARFQGKWELLYDAH